MKIICLPRWCRSSIISGQAGQMSTKSFSSCIDTRQPCQNIRCPSLPLPYGFLRILQPAITTVQLEHSLQLLTHFHHSFSSVHCQFPETMAWNDRTSKCYYAAITLNNTGVHLLGKGAVLQAHRTFSDGVVALKGVVYSERTNMNVDAMVHRAVQRMLNCKPDCKSLPINKMEVLFCDLTLPPCTGFLRSMFPTRADSWTPIHIDLFESDLSGSAPNIELSVLLHNAAITSALLSRRYPSGSSSNQRHLDNAQKFLNFSIRLALHDDPTSTCCGVPHVCGLAIAFHAAKSIIQVITSSQRPSDYDLGRYQDLLIEIRARVNHWQMTRISAMFSPVSFAAAA